MPDHPKIDSSGYLVDGEAYWDEVQDAIVRATSGDETPTWLTAGGENVAAIVPAAVLELYEELVNPQPERPGPVPRNAQARTADGQPYTGWQGPRPKR